MDDKEIRVELETIRQLVRGLRHDVNELKRTADSFEVRKNEIDSLTKILWDIDLLKVKVKKLEEKSGS